MRPWHIFSIGLAVVLLTSCGNKGDLFLLPTDVTEEQLESIDEAIDAIDQEGDSRDGLDDDPSDEQNNDKKKKEEN